MTKLERRGKTFRVLLSAVSAALGATASVSYGTITLSKNSNTSWIISNGNLNVTFNPQGEDLTSIAIGASGNLLDSGSNSKLYPEFAGTPFGAGTQTFGSVQTANYLDVWTSVASTGTSTNPLTYAFHYVFYNNDPNISTYQVVTHSATDPATSVGQGQFLARVSPSKFFNTYQVNVSPNNIGAQTGVVPAYTDSTGRDVQDATVDISGEGLAGDWGNHFYTKYDYSSYTQFLQANTEYGPTYSVSTIFTGMDTMNGGPTKQNLQYTNNIAMVEFLSDHYATGDANYSYTPQPGLATSRLFGPYDFSFNLVGGQTGAQLNAAAVASIPTLNANYDADTELAASGYVPSTARGTVAITAASTAGWSSNTNSNTAVLSDPNRSMQESSTGYQYWGQISGTGATTISNVVPGTYRMTLYQLGQWGETRVDGIHVSASTTTTPAGAQFIPENFSTSAAIWTIGTPDRSAHEFLNGNATAAANPGVVPGGDLRQFYGSYDYWAEEQTLGNPGHVVYYATAVGATSATNNPQKWIANQWQKFDPGIYDSANSTSDEYSITAPAYVLSAGGPGTYTGSAWDVNFTATQAQINQGQFVDLTVGLAANEASLVVNLIGNGTHTETWHFGGTSSDPMVRSGVAGVYQMIVFEFPTSDLAAAGAMDQFTFGVSQTDGVMYDALRMEITNTSAAPNTRGWHDYAFVNSNASTNAANADSILPTDPPTWNLSTGGSWATSGNWLFGLPNAVSATAYLTGSPGLTSSGSVTLDGSKTLGLLDFSNSNSYTVSQGTGSGSLIMDNGTAQALIVDENGNHTISAPVIMNSTTTVSTSSSSNTLTISGPISGAGNLLFSGSGTLVLSGSNSYTGTTAVNGGLLIFSGTDNNVLTNLYIAAGAAAQVGVGATAGLLPGGSVSDNGTLIFDHSTSPFTVTNTISGLGAVTQTGAGTLVLTATNTYSGGTNINTGAIKLNSASSIGTGGVSIASTGKLDVNGFSISIPYLTGSGTVDDMAAGAAPTLTLAIPVTVTGGTSPTFSGSIKNTTGTLSLLKTGVGTQFLTGVNTYAGSTTVSAGQLEIGSGGSLTSTAVSVSSGAILNVDSGGSLAAATTLTDNGTVNLNNAAQTISTITGSGTLNLTGTALNYTGTGEFFNGKIAGTGSLTVSSGSLLLEGVNTYSGSTSVTGGCLEISFGGSIASTAVSVSTGATLYLDGGPALSASTTLSDAGTFTLFSGTQTIATLNGAGSVTLHAGTLTVSGGGTLSGPITGGGGLTVSGGSLVLSGTNNYSGATSVTGGSLEIASPGSLTNTTISVSSGATLTVDSGAKIPTFTPLSDAGTVNLKNASQTIASLNGAGTLNLNPTILTITGGGSFPGVVAGTGGITVSGGALIFSGASTYTGSTSVTGGSLEIASPGSLADTAVSTSSGATLTVDSGASLANSTILSDAGTVILQEAIQNIASLNGAGTLNLNPTALTVTGGGTFSGPITGSGSLTTSGGTLLLSATETYTGATTVTGGRFEIASPGSLASTAVSTTFAGATLTVDSGASLSASTALSDAGTVILNNTSQTIATLNGGGNLNLNPTALTVTGGGSFSGSVSGIGSLTASGSTLTLGGSISVPTITVSPAATLNINGPVSGTPAVTANGAINIGPGNSSGPSAVTVGSLTVGAAGNVTVQSALSQSNRTVLVVNQPIAFANTPVAPLGSVDLRDNDLIVHNDTLGNVVSEFAAAYNGGSWNGAGGITSSVAAGTRDTTLAIVLNDDGTGTSTPLVTGFDGQTVGEGDVLVKYTYYGDADLDGVVSSGDYIAIDNGFNMGLGGWQNGDFNYDGMINGDDYTLIDNAFNTQGSVSFAGVEATEMVAGATEQVAAGGGSAVPEPGSLGLLGIGAGLLARRRRRDA